MRHLVPLFYPKEKGGSMISNLAQRPVLVISLALLCSLQCSHGSSPAKSTLKEVIALAMNSLVIIYTEDKDGNAVGQASGFAIAKGTIVTNLHAFKWAYKAKVKRMNENIPLEVKSIIAFDREHDLAILRVDGEGQVDGFKQGGEGKGTILDQLETKDASFPSLWISAKTDVALGDEVIVIGNPKGLEGTVSRGMVSGIRRQMGLIQIDAPISQGSSGGPVLDAEGGVIGVACASMIDGQNLNFAIPADYLVALKAEWDLSVQDAGKLALTDREYLKYNGPVSTVREESAEVALEGGSLRYSLGGRKPNQNITFNRTGNISEEVSYYPKATDTTTYFYGTNGLPTRQLVQSTAKYAKDTDSVLDPFEGLTSVLIKHPYCEEGGGGMFRYDCRGNEVFLKARDGSTYSSDYDSEDLLVQMRSYDAGGSLQAIFRYKYESDARGNWVKRFVESYSPKYAKLGYTPTQITYREITYY
jgi:hypothetical protein